MKAVQFPKISIAVPISFLFTLHTPSTLSAVPLNPVESSGVKGSHLVSIRPACNQLPLHSLDFRFPRQRSPQETPIAKALAEIALQYTAVGQFDSAVRVAESIESDYLKAITLVKIASQSIPEKRVDQAKQILSQAMQATQTIKVAQAQATQNNDTKVEVLVKIPAQEDDRKAEVLAEISVQYAALGEFNQAQTIAQAISDPAWKANALGGIVRQYTATGQYDLALQIARSIQNNSKQKDQAFADIAVQLIGVGQSNKAVQIVQTIGDHCAKERTLAIIVNQLIEKGNYHSALPFAQMIQDDNYKPQVLVNLSAQYVSAEANTALQLLSQAINSAQKIEYPYSKAHLFGQIAVQYAARGQADTAQQLLSQALQTAQNLEEKDMRVRALAVIASQYATVGDTNTAEKIVSQAIKTAQTIEIPPSQADALHNMGMILAEAKQFPLTLSVAQTLGLNAAEFTYERDLRVQLLHNIALMSARAKQFPLALKTGESLEYEAMKATALTEIAVNLASAQQYDEALQVVQKIESQAQKNTALVQIAGQYATAEQRDKAAEILSQALEKVNLTKDSHQKVILLTQIASQYATAGQRDKAAEILSQAFKTAEVVKKQPPLQDRSFPTDIPYPQSAD